MFSMSKPVFAYAVMKLCERGVLSLDAPLTKYTPERFLEGDPRLDLITARHVLSQTAGFQNWREEGDGQLKIYSTPGERFQYSGEGYSYLLSVVTHVTGQPRRGFENRVDIDRRFRDAILDAERLAPNQFGVFDDSHRQPGDRRRALG
jgi:CubicO group peptidase (beta-lactamase class C family)